MNVVRLLLAAALGAFLSGCGSIDVGASSSPDRVLTGTVNTGGSLPAGAEIVVRLVASGGTNDSLRAAPNDIPVMTRPAGPATEQMLGEQVQTLAAGTADPVPFRLEYRVDDAVLRRGLNLDVRVSFGGKLRFRTINAHVVTLASSPYPQNVALQPVDR